MIRTFSPVLIFLSILLSILQVIILNKDSTSGEQLTVLLDHTKKIEEDNERLTQDIASLSALLVISHKATALGLRENSRTFSLMSSVEIAHGIRLFR